MLSISISGKSLSERLEEFLWTFDGFENVDDLLRGGNDVIGKRRADYLLKGRSIIIEKKSLVSDPKDKPQKYIEQLVREGRFVFWGTRSTDDIFRQLPDGVDLQKKMFDKLTKRLDDDVAEADDQTRDTREIFKIPDAIGVIVLLNEGAKTLVPDVIRYGIQRVYVKRNRDGSRRYTQNTCVIVLNELHAMNLGGETSFPIQVFVDQASPQADVCAAFSIEFQERWAAFNGAPLRNVTQEEIAQIR